MHRYHQRNAVILLRQDTSKVRVPGMAVDDIGVDQLAVEIRAPTHCSKHRTQRLRTTELFRVDLEAFDSQISRPESLVAKTADIDRYEFGQLPREIFYVYSGTAVGIWRIFVGEQKDFHAKECSAGVKEYWSVAWNPQPFL